MKRYDFSGHSGESSPSQPFRQNFQADGSLTSNPAAKAETDERAIDWLPIIKVTARAILLRSVAIPRTKKRSGNILEQSKFGSAVIGACLASFRKATTIPDTFRAYLLPEVVEGLPEITYDRFIKTRLQKGADMDDFIETTDGVLIHVRHFKAESPKAVLIIAHGLQSHAGWFEQTGNFLAPYGVSVLAYDRRGSGRSTGARGDVKSASDFEVDLDAVVREASKPAVAVHLLANCFATRFCIPYVHRHPGAIRSLIVTSPATDMRPEADYSALGKVGILLRSFSPIKLRVATPLRDELFVSKDPWLTWIHNDRLSLRKVTPRFLMAAFRAEKEMFNALVNVQIPIFVMLAKCDQMVFNDRIFARFKKYFGPLKVQTFESEHMLEFGQSVAEYHRELLDWLRTGHRTASFAPQRPPALIHPLPSPAMWLGNGSLVNFVDLEKLESQVYGFGGEWQRFEGFFDDYVEGELAISVAAQRGKCLSPEVEWTLVCTDPEELDKIYDDNDPKEIDMRIRALNVELRGMIEGKWLDVLRDEAAAPNWIPASGANNVVTQKGLASRVDGLDALVRSKDSRIEVFRVPRDGSQSSGNSTGYFSTLRDIRGSPLLQAFPDRNEGLEPLFCIVRAVFDQWHRKGEPMRRLRAINLSALGKASALVLNKPRQDVARAMKFKQIVLRFGRFLFVENDQVEPRIGMHLITSRAVREGNNGLKPGFDYLLVHTDPREGEIGCARLRVVESGATNDRAKRLRRTVTVLLSIVLGLAITQVLLGFGGKHRRLDRE